MLIDQVSTSDVKPLGNTGEKVSTLGIGTKGIYNYRLAEEAITYAFSLGLKLVEVSERYGNGLVEELIGRTIKRFKRDEIFIILRVEADRFSDADSAAKTVLSSLRRMSISYADVVLLSGLSDIIQMETQIKALENLVDKGLTRYIGLSNFKLKDIIKALELLSKHSIVMVQAKYNVLDKKVERDILKFAIEKGITFAACTPLEKGEVRKNPKLIYISSKYGKTPIQVALNYIISKPYVIATPKSERKAHIDEIYGALGWRLGIEDIKFLESNI